MPAQTLDAFMRSLAKGDPAAAYYFHGPEYLLKDEALRALMDRVLDPALRDFNLDQRGAAFGEFRFGRAQFLGDAVQLSNRGALAVVERKDLRIRTGAHYFEDIFVSLVGE